VVRAAGFAATRLTVLEALGGPAERVRTVGVDAVPADVGPLVTVALEVAGEGRAVPLAPGLPDDWFEHDGQITKREVRALALSALAPRHGDTLWDVGAGAGSVAVEWLLAGAGAAVAVERDGARAARIARNARALGVPTLAVVEGAAPAALAGLPRPDAVFVGGGAGDGAVLDAALAALRPGGRLVVHAVTLETEAALAGRHARHGGTLTRVEIARAAPLGGMTGWRPALPVTQWALTVAP
jgi:precorrin-6B C5,15-methyltransferase / cobalt-precorrin-6B C5,C15-methyltransferase